MNFLNTTELIFLHKIVKKSNPFAQVHRDLRGPLRIHTVMGVRWFVTFIDDHTRVCWVYLLKGKFETKKIFKVFQKMFQTQSQAKVCILKIDNGKEYFSKVLGTYLVENVIIHQSLCVNIPQHNGIDKRKNYHLLEVVEALKFQMRVPKQY